MLTQRPSQLDQCLTILEKGLEPQPLAQAPQELAPETEESVVSQVLSPSRISIPLPQVMSPQEGAAPAVLTADDEIRSNRRRAMLKVTLQQGSDSCWIGDVKA